MASPEREQIARRYGFASFAELLAVSRPLPLLEDDFVQAYVARRPGGWWFIWEDAPPDPRHAIEEPEDAES